MAQAQHEFTKDPSAVLDYALDLSAWLDEGELIQSLTVEADDGITIDSSTFTGSYVVAWLSGGEIDKRYKVTFHWATNQTREDERSVIINVRQR